jgi:hypothetical protein
MWIDGQVGSRRVRKVRSHTQPTCPNTRQTEAGDAKGGSSTAFVDRPFDGEKLLLERLEVRQAEGRLEHGQFLEGDHEERASQVVRIIHGRFAWRLVHQSGTRLGKFLEEWQERLPVRVDAALGVETKQERVAKVGSDLGCPLT